MFKSRSVRLAAIAGFLLCMTAGIARAQGVQVFVEQMTCYAMTAGEPGSEDEIYFTLGGLNNQGTIAVPRVGSSTMDHWDIRPGQSYSGFRLYQGYLAPGQAAFLAVLMRESDGAILSGIINALGTFVLNVLSPLTNGFSLGLISPLIPLAENFTAAFSSDSDQTVASFAIGLQNVNGSLQVQLADVQTSVTTPLGNNRFQTIATGYGAVYVLTYRVELYAGDRITNVRSGYCIDVPNGSTADGVQVQQYPCHTGPNQRWIFLPDAVNSPSYYTVVNEWSGKCLDVRGASPSPGAAIQQYGCHGGTNQRWHLMPVTAGSGNGQIKSDSSGLCIDVPYASYSVVGLQQYTCGVPMPKNQAWIW